MQTKDDGHSYRNVLATSIFVICTLQINNISLLLIFIRLHTFYTLHSFIKTNGLSKLTTESGKKNDQFNWFSSECYNFNRSPFYSSTCYIPTGYRFTHPNDTLPLASVLLTRMLHSHWSAFYSSEPLVSVLLIRMLHSHWSAFFSSEC